MPKFLQINVDSALYSCGKICEDIAIVAQSKGWDTYIAYGREHKDGVNREIHVGNMFYVYEHYFEQRFFDNEGGASRIPTKRLVEKIKEIAPDVIQLHVIHDHWLNYRILFDYLATLNIPIVWTLHDCWPFTGGCFYYDLENCDRWRTQCESCPQKRSFLFDQTERQFRKRMELYGALPNLTLVPVSNWLAESARSSILKDKRIVTIHNGINLSIFKPIPSGKKRKDIFDIIGVAAVWDRRKGLDDFIKLRAILPPKYHITLVGLKKEQIEKLPEGIKGIQKTYNVEELVQLYSDADVFVNTTYSDNFPTTNIEALACGCPVITYNTGGSPEAICDDESKIEQLESTNFETGYVVPQGKITEVAKVIKNMAEMPETDRLKQREACRIRAEENFDKNNCFKKYLSLYEELNG